MARRRKAPDDIQRPESHETDEAARRIFVNALPLGWVHNQLHNDYAKDYHVEIKDPTTNAITGNIFYAQIKGTRSLHVVHRGRKIAFSLERRYSKHYAEEAKHPVFLVVIDVKTGQGYWIFTQEYLRQHPKWYIKATFTYHIPVQNRLADFPAFEKEIERAIPYMRAYSIDILDKVKHDVAELEAKDRRIRIQPLITLDRVEYSLHPTEPIDVQLSLVNTPEAREKMDTLYEKGLPVQFDAGEMKVTGSGLIEEFTKNGVTMQVSSRVEGEAAIVLHNAEGKEAFRFSNIRGICEGGRQVAFRTTMPLLPFSLSFGPFVLPDPSGPPPETPRGRISISSAIEIWKGQPLLGLAYFDQTLELYSALRDYRSITVEFGRAGNWWIRIPTVIPALKEFETFAGLLRVVQMAREVARKVNVSPIWDRRFMMVAHLEEIGILYGMLFRGSFDFGKGPYSLQLTMPKDQFPSDLEQKWDSHKMVMPNHMMHFLGEKVPVSNVVLEMVNARIGLNKKQQHKFVQTSAAMIAVPFEIAENGGARMRLAKPEEVANAKDPREGPRP